MEPLSTALCGQCIDDGGGNQIRCLTELYTFLDTASSVEQHSECGFVGSIDRSQDFVWMVGEGNSKWEDELTALVRVQRGGLGFMQLNSQCV